MRLPQGNLSFFNNLGRAAAYPVRPPQVRTPWGLDVPAELMGAPQNQPQLGPAPIPGPQMQGPNRQALLMQLLRSSGRGARY